MSGHILLNAVVYAGSSGDSLRPLTLPRYPCFRVNSVGCRWRSALSLEASSAAFIKRKLVFQVGATGEDEPGSSDFIGPRPLAVIPVEETDGPTEIEKLKKELVDSSRRADRGLRTTKEMKSQIGELVSKFETKNPTPAPTEALPLLNGKWVLIYTSSSSLFPLLTRATPPLVRVDEITQTIDTESFTVQNSVLFCAPLSTTRVSASAKFEIRSPLCVQIKFLEGVIGTPQLTDSIEVPASVDFLGKKIDLVPFRCLISSLQNTASTVVKTVSALPPMKFPILCSRVESWLLTTYLDEELRISRDERGSVFALVKEGSPLLSPPAEAVADY